MRNSFRLHCNDSSTRRFRNLVYLLLAGLRLCLAAGLFSAAVPLVAGPTILFPFGANPGNTSPTYTGTCTVNLVIHNNGTGSASLTGTNPDSFLIAYPVPGNNGATFTTNSSYVGYFNSTTATTWSATVVSGSSVTIQRTYPYFFFVARTQNPSGVNRLYLPAAWTSFGPYDCTCPAFTGSYTKGTDAAKQFTFPMTHRIQSTTVNASGLTVVPPIQFTFDLYLGGGDPTVAAASGKALFVANIRGKLAAGCTINLKLLADSTRGLAASTNLAGTSVEGSKESDLVQFGVQVDNPVGNLNGRRYVWEIKRADGSLLAQGFGTSPQWDGKMNPGDPPAADYGFVCTNQISVVGRSPGTNPVATAPTTYNPATSPNVTSPTKLDNYESTSKALSDTLGAGGSLPDINGGDYSGDYATGVDGAGKLKGAASWGTRAVPRSVGSTGSSPVLTIGQVQFSFATVSGIVQVARTALAGLLLVMIFVQSIKLFRATSAH